MAMKLIKVCDEPRWNRKAYVAYVLLPSGKIESGWEYLEDARDRLQELREDGIRARVVSARALAVDPEDKANWHKGSLR